ncbi:hypothetical protein V9T40_014413 [Parthenolecanium corni]|uniref:Uncharacterized protein n=1 Tax=Parthenolecanium corni TaxID=536013 RepID=A0AAN9T5U1_9HEMI
MILTPREVQSYKNAKQICRLVMIKDGKLSSEGSDALAKARFGDKAELLQKAHEIFEKCQTSYTPSNEKCALGKHIRNCFILNDNDQAKENGTTPSSGSTRQSTTDKVSTVKVSTVKVDANKTANNSKILKASDPFQNRLNQVANDCKKELNAQQEIVALLSSGALPTNEKQRCFLECVYNKLGLIKDNKLSEEGATNLAKQKFGENKDMTAKADALFKTCKTEAVVTEKDAKEKCALGRLIRTCIVKHGQGLPIFAAKA